MANTTELHTGCQARSTPAQQAVPYAVLFFDCTAHGGQVSGLPAARPHKPKGPGVLHKRGVTGKGLTGRSAEEPPDSRSGTVRRRVRGILNTPP